MARSWVKGPQIRSNRVAIETQRIPRQVTIYKQDCDESEGAGRKNAKRKDTSRKGDHSESSMRNLSRKDVPIRCSGSRRCYAGRNNCLGGEPTQ